MTLGKLSKHWRPLHDYWSYNGDGRFDHYRIKGADKRYLKRKTRRVMKRELSP